MDKLIGSRGSNNLYTISSERASETSSLRARPATLSVPTTLPLHETLNHENTKTLSEFKRDYLNSATHILNKLATLQKQKGHTCIPCVVGKAKRRLFGERKDITNENLDEVFRETTGLITPPGMEGSVYLKLIVDAATGHTQVFSMKKKGDGPRLYLRASNDYISPSVKR